MLLLLLVLQECEKTLMQYNRKLDCCGDCDMTEELSEALLTLTQDTGVQLCIERAAEFSLLDYAE